MLDTKTSKINLGVLLCSLISDSSLHTGFIEAMITGIGIGFQKKTTVSEEEEGHIQCSEAKEGLEEASMLHTEPPGWRGRDVTDGGRKSIYIGGGPRDDGH